MLEDNQAELQLEKDRMKLSKAALIIDALSLVDQISDLVKDDNGRITGTIVWPVITIDGAQREELISSLLEYLT